MTDMDSKYRVERMDTFLNSFYKGNPEYLNRIEADARERFINVIRPGTQQALRMFLELIKPASILEVGSAIGFSALFMAEYSGAGIITIEHDPERASEACANIEEYGSAGRITVLTGQAEDIIPGLDGPFDLVFLDSAKGQYIKLLPALLEKMKSGSVLIADNVLSDGDTMESVYTVRRRDRTIHRRMREFLESISLDERFESTLLPVGDGLSVTVMK